MSVQLPPNSSGSTIETFTGSTKTYNLGERQVVSIGDGSKATYSATYSAQSIGTAATTAIFYLAGSATMVVRLVQLIVSATIATAGEEYDFILQKETTLPTGGTKATAATITPWDSSDPAATATTAFYTATPTDGTVTGVLLVAKLTAYIKAATTVLPPNNVFNQTFGSAPNAKALVLRGATQGIVATINAATPANASAWDVTFVWTEDSGS